MQRLQAWADPAFTRSWLEHTLGPELRRLCPDGKPSILIADNLAGQDPRFSAGEVGRRAKAAAAAAGCELWNTVEGCTDAIQPVDAGLGREVKRCIGQISGEWLDTEANLDRWEGAKGCKTLEAWERRVLMAQWANEAWKRVCARPNMLRRYFERTGCHLGVEAGGELDKLVALEQLTAAERAAYVDDLKIPYNDADAKVR